MTEKFLHSRQYETHRKELEKCQTGLEQDKLLEQTIILAYPECVQFVPRLQNELLECRREMTFRLPPGRRVIPVSKINYAGSFADSVNKLTERLGQETQQTPQL